MEEETKRNLSEAEYRVLRKVHGTKCRICGAEDAEYHHIIPLSWGGTNDINNFLPLCHEHHLIVHGVLNQGSTARTVSHKGRTRIVPDDYESILERYIHCEIGTLECHSLLGLGQSTKISSGIWYKEFLVEKDIFKLRNNVDLLRHHDSLEHGRSTGYILYNDGRKECFFWESEAKMIYPKNTRRKP